MKLAPEAFERLTQIDTRFNRLGDKFNLFLQQLTFFNEARCPLKGVVVEAAADARCVSVQYRTVKLTLRLLFQLNEQNSPSARVVVTLEKPDDGKFNEELGAFTFNLQGFTDFELDADGDPIDLEGKALEIVVHFLSLALKHGAALPSV